MAETATNVSNAKPKTGGAAYCAPLGTQVPTDATTALNAAFKSMGYISEDGLTNNNGITTETKKAWGGAIVMSGVTERNDTWKFKLIETLNTDVLKAVYGSTAVSGTALSTGISVAVDASDMPAQAWVFEMVLKGGVAKRVVLPNASIKEMGEIVYKDNDTIGYDITLQAMPDSSGKTHYEYIKGPVTGSGTGG